MAKDSKFNGQIVNKSELCEILGCSQTTITTYQKNGLPIEVDGGRGQSNSYNTKDVIEWLIDWRLRKLSSPKNEALYIFEEERARLTHHQANREALKEMEEQGELIPAEHVARQDAEKNKAFVQLIDQLPDILERDHGLPPDIIAHVVAGLDDFRNICAQALANAAEHAEITEESEVA
jgi:phage terminase Nu1 subunit (DNA packaging protein)